MKKLVQKFGIIIIALLIPISVSAYDFKVDGLCYNILSQTDRTVAVTRYFGEEYVENYKGDIVIPENVVFDSKTYTVISIWKEAFFGCSQLTSVSIPNTVIGIGQDAFNSCRSLTTIDIPNSVISIGKWAFYYCEGLTSLVIPNSVTDIGREAFRGCKSLTSLTISNSLTEIGESVFCDCRRLTSVTIPNSVINIGFNAFGDCTSLTSVLIGNSVTKIDYGAFSSCSSLTSVFIPNSVIELATSAFAGCENLESINVDKGNEEYSSIDGVLYNKDASTLILCPFAKQTITIPSSVIELSNATFARCGNMESINVDKGNEKFSSIDGVLYNKDASTLFECPPAKQAINIPSSVTSLGISAFEGCKSLTTVTIPNSITEIGKDAFRNCTGLTSVSIPNSVTVIGYFAFHLCDKLEKIYMQCTTPIVCDPIFSEKVRNNAFLYVPVGTLAAYEKIAPWKYFKNIEEIDYSGVEDVEVDGELQISVEGGRLNVGGIDADDIITVYDLSGRLVYSGAEHTLSGLSHGVYILKVRGKTAKFAI